jgi:hypothetical protein
MKGYVSITVLLLALLIAAASCRKFESGYPGVKTFSFQTPIVFPPDTFMIIYNFTAYGDKTANVVLDTSGVWRIERISDPRLSVVVRNQQMQSFIINIADTLGLQGNSNYQVVATNTSGQIEYNNFYLLFTKLDIDYASFEPKF